MTCTNGIVGPQWWHREDFLNICARIILFCVFWAVVSSEPRMSQVPLPKQFNDCKLWLITKAENMKSIDVKQKGKCYSVVSYYCFITFFGWEVIYCKHCFPQQILCRIVCVYLCVGSICMCVSLRVYVHSGLSMHVWRTETLAVFLYCFLSYFFQWGFLTEPGTGTEPGAGQLVPGICLSPPAVLGSRHMPAYSAFMWVLWIWILTLPLVWQAPPSPNYLPCPLLGLLIDV